MAFEDLEREEEDFEVMDTCGDEEPEVDFEAMDEEDHEGRAELLDEENFIRQCEQEDRAARRRLTDHKLNGLNDVIEVLALDAPGSGGASHEYVMSINGKHTRISFQNGPVLEAGFNGLSNEALLTIVIDRMRGFAEGPFRCRENSIALTHLEDAIMWLQKRTRDRLARDVEGTHQQ